HLRNSALYLTLLISGHALSTEPAPDYLSKDMRQTQIGALVGTLVASAQVYLSGKGIFSDLPDALDASKEFVEQIAQEHGITPDFQVKLGDGYGAGIGAITVPVNDNS